MSISHLQFIYILSISADINIYPLLQPLPVIIPEPVLQRLLKRPFELIPAPLQLLPADIRGNLQLLHSCRTNPHGRPKQHRHPCHRHDHPVRHIRHPLRQPRHPLHRLHDMLYRISRLEATVINLCTQKSRTTKLIVFIGTTKQRSADEVKANLTNRTNILCLRLDGVSPIRFIRLIRG